MNETKTIEAWIGEKISLNVDDYFQIKKGSFAKPIDVVWDRASLVAIDLDKRKHYIDTMGEVIKPGGKILLVTIEKRKGDEEALEAGPPYSINEAAVRQLYENAKWVDSVQLIEEYDEFVENPADADRWKSKGIEEMYELCFLITAKGKEEE